MGRMEKSLAAGVKILRSTLIRIRNRIRFLSGFEYSWAASLVPNGSLRYNHDKEVFEKYDNFWGHWFKIKTPKKVPSYFLYLKGNPGCIIDPNR